MARHCFLTILTSGKPEVPNDATIISIKDEQLLNTGLWKTYWCVLRRVAGWVAWGCWDDYETNDDWDHSRKFPTFSISKSERSCFDLMSILRMFAGVPQVAWKWLSTGRIKRWWNRVTNSNSSRQFVFGFFCLSDCSMPDLPTNRGHGLWDHHGSSIDIPWIPWQRPPLCPESSKSFRQNHSRPFICIIICICSELFRITPTLIRIVPFC